MMDFPPPTPGAGWTPATAQGAWTYDLAAEAGAPPRRLFLGAPEGALENARDSAAAPTLYPLVIVLDGADFFHALHDTSRRLRRRPVATGIAPAFILGIDTTETGEARVARRRSDLIWTPSQDRAEAPDGAPAPAGAAYLDLILNRLLPRLTAALPIDTAALSLFGHSLAGNFALHALAAAPRTFRAVGAVSPSLWWNRDATFAALDAADLTGARLFLAVGENEEGPAARAHAGPRRMVANVQDLAHRLRPRFPDGAFRFDLFPEEDHGSVVNIAMVRFLRMATPPA